jgi:hypothetical protein
VNSLAIQPRRHPIDRGCQGFSKSTQIPLFSLRHDYLSLPVHYIPFE